MSKKFNELCNALISTKIDFKSLDGKSIKLKTRGNTMLIYDNNNHIKVCIVNHNGNVCEVKEIVLFNRTIDALNFILKC
ncbi:MAG: hypothetical protein RR359_04815 [Bacilli bacterium]